MVLRSYDECVGKLTPFLKQSGYNVQKGVHWVPISGLTGANIVDKVTPDKCTWYDGPSLVNLLDNIKIGGRNPDGPLRIPVLDKYTDRGTVRGACGCVWSMWWSMWMA